jgi:hypothetical protein
MPGSYFWFRSTIRNAITDKQEKSSLVLRAGLHPLTSQSQRLCPADQLSSKVRKILDRLGCLSLRSALASIWRMRSRVTENCWPTSSSV